MSEFDRSHPLTRTNRPLIMSESEAADILKVDESALLTREEVAGRLRVTVETLREWGRAGRGPECIAVGPRSFVYARRDVDAYIKSCRSNAATSPAPSHAAAVKAAIEGDRRRIRMILSRAPESYTPAALAAIKSGMSLEAFDASLPGELRAFMPPLHRFIADFDRPDDGGNAAADSIITTVRALRGN